MSQSTDRNMHANRHASWFAFVSFPGGSRVRVCGRGEGGNDRSGGGGICYSTQMRNHSYRPLILRCVWVFFVVFFFFVCLLFWAGFFFFFFFFWFWVCLFVLFVCCCYCFWVVGYLDSAKRKRLQCFSLITEKQNYAMQL